MMAVRIRGTFDETTGACADFWMPCPADDPLYLLDLDDRAEDELVYGGPAVNIDPVCQFCGGVTDNKTPSYFGDCKRDAKGQCIKGNGGKPAAKGKAGGGKQGRPGQQPSQQPAVDPKFMDKGNVEVASDAEIMSARRMALKKIRSAPVPGPDKVKKGREELAKAKLYDRQAKQLRDAGHSDAEIKKKLGSPPRAGGDSRGSSKDRKARAKKLFSEFGGDQQGYVVCHGTGIKMHWTADPKQNPGGYPTFEQGKIFTKHQGGGYVMGNLLPESKTWNRGRNDKPVRKENLD